MYLQIPALWSLQSMRARVHGTPASLQIQGQHDSLSKPYFPTVGLELSREFNRGCVSLSVCLSV
jgi:hypothetical protein